MVMIRVAAESLSVPIGTNMSRVIHVTERRVPFESINQLGAGRLTVLKIDATGGSRIGQAQSGLLDWKRHDFSREIVNVLQAKKVGDEFL